MNRADTFILISIIVQSSLSRSCCLSKSSKLSHILQLIIGLDLSTVPFRSAICGTTWADPCIDLSFIHNQYCKAAICFASLEGLRARTWGDVILRLKITSITFKMPENPAKEMSDMHTTSRPSASASRTLCGRKTIAFISGHMDITPEQFAQHYHTRLDEALSQGHHFVMGDAKGVDTTALAYLLTQSVTYPGVQERITVYLSRPGQLGRYQAMGVQTVWFGTI